MTLKSDAKFKEKLTCGFKYDMKDLVNFYPTTQKSESFTSMGYFCTKYIRFEPKKIQRSCLSWHWIVKQNLNKPWPCGFKNSIINWGELSLEHSRSEKLCNVDSFCQKHIMFQLENFRGIICHDNEWWCKI